MKKISVILSLLMIVLIAAGCTDTDENTGGIEKTSAYSSEDVIIGKGTEWELNGVLTVPQNSGEDNPCPAVVLVHGSGPQDMNEAIYENKPFLDIADYLSSHGTAVIRYDKRTLTHGQKMMQELGGSLTVYEETVEDALLAADILKSDPRINKDKVFILGHSMGGMLAPRIHAEDGDFAGIISLAGSPRSIHEISYDQQLAFVKTMPEGKEKDDASALLDKGIYDASVAELLSLPDDEAKTAFMPGGISAYYYKEWDQIPVSDYVNNIDIPFLIMQGSADLQVFADKDFTAWQELLEGRSNVTFKVYDNLNHYFMRTAGKSINELNDEYAIPGHVDESVLTDISDWIKDN